MSRAELQLLAAISEAGFPVPSVAAIRDQYSPLPSGLAALLLEWIPRLEDRRLQESVAWALLAARSGTLDGAALAELFDAATNDELKRAIASVINQTRPRNIDEWLIAAVRDRRSGTHAICWRQQSRRCCCPNEQSRCFWMSFATRRWRPCIRSAKSGTAACETFSRRALPTATGPLRASCGKRSRGSNDDWRRLNNL